MMNRILIIGLVVGLLSAEECFPQEQADSSWHAASDTTVQQGDVRIIQDERVGRLVDKHVQINEERESFPGYRVQVYFGSGSNARTGANKVKSEFIIKYPGIPVYVQWDKPNYKVRVGDCRTRLEAEALRNAIAEDFPATYIVKDMIRFPELTRKAE